MSDALTTMHELDLAFCPSKYSRWSLSQKALIGSEVIARAHFGGALPAFRLNGNHLPYPMVPRTGRQIGRLLVFTEHNGSADRLTEHQFDGISSPRSMIHFRLLLRHALGSRGSRVLAVGQSQVLSAQREDEIQ